MNPITTKEMVARPGEEDRGHIHVVEDDSNGNLPFKAFDCFAQKYSPREDGSIEKQTTKYETSQNQVYFYQKYKHQRDNPGNSKGGFHGLAGRATKGDRKDLDAYYSEREGLLMF